MSPRPLVVRDPNYVERIKDGFGRQGFLRYINARIEELVPGRCVITADFSSELTQQNGYFHGGLIGTMVDAAGACAASTLIGVEQWMLTTEYKINFLTPAKSATAQSRGRGGQRAGRTPGQPIRRR
jgi:uncharacterized protein (TIGR00369 family)